MAVDMDRKVLISLIITILALIIVVSIAQVRRKSTSSVPAPSATREIEIGEEMRVETPESHYAIPANPLPTNAEMEESLKLQNERRQLLDKMLAKRMRRAAVIRIEAATCENEPTKEEREASGQDIKVKPSKQDFKQTPKEAADEIQSQGYLIH